MNTAGLRRRATDRRVFFPWEARRSRLALFVRRHVRLGLIGLVAGVAAWGLSRVEARKRAVFSTRATIAVVGSAIEAYRADHDGHCPTDLAELVNPSDEHEPYLPRMPRDGWGNEFHFQCPGRRQPASADVISAGPSGSFEDTDQIQ